MTAKLTDAEAAALHERAQKGADLLFPGRKNTVNPDFMQARYAAFGRAIMNHEGEIALAVEKEVARELAIINGGEFSVAAAIRTAKQTVLSQIQFFAYEAGLRVLDPRD